MKVCLLFIVTLVAVAAQDPSMVGMGQPAGGAPMSTGQGMPTSGGASTGTQVQAPYDQYMQQSGQMYPQYPQNQQYLPFQSPQFQYPPFMYQPFQYQQQQQRQRQNTFNPLNYWMFRQNDNPMIRYMLLSGQPINPLMFLLNN